MALLGNLAYMSTGTSGTGTVTLGSAVSGFLTFAQAGIPTGAKVTYLLEDGNNREVGFGVYTTSGTTLSRDTVISSTNSGAKISLSGFAKAMVVASTEDYIPRAPLRLTASSRYLYIPMTDMSSNGPAANRVYFAPIYVPSPITTTAVAIRLAGAASPAGSVRLGIYAKAPGSYLQPGKLIIDAGTSSTGSGGVVEKAAAVRLDPGWHFTAAQIDSNVTGLGIYVANRASSATFFDLTQLDCEGGLYRDEGSFAALNSDYSANTATGDFGHISPPVIMIKY